MPGDLLLCYNRGCGKEYDPAEDDGRSCVHHPGAPFFHDAYKGWSCCNKKCTDFTEFLNIKGCATSCHSNVKPEEPEKPIVDKKTAADVIRVRAPIGTVKRLPRPPSDTPTVRLNPKIASSLIKQLENLVLRKNTSSGSLDEIAIGTACKNGGCKVQFQGFNAEHGSCTYHPGTPVFHEGLKFWSCCKKRTTDFAAFLEQVGCETGNHKWTGDANENSHPVCRYDWHQTGNDVIVAVYAKKYNPNKSSVEVSPVRLKINVYFPEEDDIFDLNLELRGIVSVDESEVNMLSTKLEIQLRKAEPGSWRTLELPNSSVSLPEKTESKEKTNDEFDDSPVDLGDL